MEILGKLIEQITSESAYVRHNVKEFKY